MFNSRELLARAPERLVLLGYRNMMSAYEFGDTASWEEIWRSFILDLGVPAARRTAGEVQYWMRAIRANAGRALGFYPHRCFRLCDDECIAVSLVAAAQSGDDEAGLFAAAMLTGTAEQSRNDDIWHASSHLAAALQGAGRSLSACPRTIIHALCSEELGIMTTPAPTVSAITLLNRAEDVPQLPRAILGTTASNEGHR